MNLNELVPAIEFDGDQKALDELHKHLEPASSSATVKCFFRDLDSELVKLINQSYGVVGCVAWLTHPDVLQALAEKELVSIIVQKEDFLRPDTEDWSAQKLRSMYGGLKSNLSDFHRVVFPNVNYCSGISSDPIRILGNVNSDKLPAFPRMHHKFLVFCEGGEDYVYNSKDCTPDSICGVEPYLYPLAVWTGSFNITKNAGMSLENAVLITGSEAVNQYFNEWRRVWMLSHSIDNWHLDPWEPSEHRIGS
jgi:hypothetical protein